MEVLTNVPPPQAPIAEVKGMRFIPDGDGLLIALDDPEERTKGGIIIPDTYKKKVQTGVVVEIGPGLWDHVNGRYKPMSKKPGDRILISKMAGVPLILDDKEVLLTNEREILGKFIERAPGEELPMDKLPSYKDQEKKRKEQFEKKKAENGGGAEKGSSLILPDSVGKKEAPESEQRVSLVGGAIPEDPQVIAAKPKRVIKCNIGGCDTTLEAPGEATDAEVRTTLSGLGWKMPLGFARNVGLCPEHAGGPKR
jgi:chaperonin GroES